MRPLRRRLFITAAAGALVAPVGALAGAASAATAPPAPENTSAFCANMPAGYQPFSDVNGDAAQANIRCLSYAGITQGVTATTYGPQRTTTRAQMASFIVRMMRQADQLDTGTKITALPPPDGTDHFTDDNGDAHEADINLLAQAGIVSGGPGGRPATSYGPNLTVTRGQMASFVNRAQRYLTGTAYSSGNDYFTDDDQDVHQPDINAVASVGIAVGGTDGRFRPAARVTRSEMSSFVVRDLAVDHDSGKIAGLPVRGVLAYQVSPSTKQKVPLGQTANYNATGLGTTVVDIVLFDCPQVSKVSGGYTIAGTDPGNPGDYAQSPTNAAKVTVVNSQSQGNPGNTVTQVAPVSGKVTFTVTDATNECVQPVVYQRGTGSNPDRLPLGSDGRPATTYGVGGNAQFVPAEAPAGAFNPASLPISQQPGSATVTQTDKGFGYFVEGTGTNGAQQTYYYDSGDTYQRWSGGQCAASTYADFQKRLSVGDSVGGDYQPNSKSTFCLNDTSPAPPASVQATQGTVSNGTPGGPGITVTWTDSPTPTVASYAVYRSTATTSPLGTSCPATTGSGWTRLGTTADRDPSAASNTTSYTFNDTGAATGTDYCYYVASVDDGGQQGAPSAAAGPTAGKSPPAAPVPQTVPAFTKAAAGGKTVTVYYNVAVNTATVDADGSDFAVTVGGVAGAVAGATPANDGPSGHGTVVLRLATAIPPGQSVQVTARAGKDTNTVCASGSTKNCQQAGDSTSATAGPGFASASASAGKVVITYDEPIMCTTVDADASDYTVDMGGLPVTGLKAQCTSGNVTTDTRVTLSGFVGLSTVSVTSKVGADGNVVNDPKGHGQPVGDSVTS